MTSTVDSDFVLLHNPACSKSLAAKQWLDDQGVTYAVREYLESPLTELELVELAGKLGAPLREWVRDDQALNEVEGMLEVEQNESLARFVGENPSAMQRPILVRGDRARIGRPLEALKELL
ncbi:MAG: arsenate reductase [Glaciecola sp.]|jgi:arsenate reductase